MILNLHHSCSFAQKYCAYDFLRRSGRTTWRSEDLPTERTDGQRDLAFRLYRRVIEIDDGRLLLRPYMSPATIVVMGHLELSFPLAPCRRHSPRPRRRIVGFTDEILKDLYDHSKGRLPDRPAVPELRRPHPALRNPP